MNSEHVGMEAHCAFSQRSGLHHSSGEAGAAVELSAANKVVAMNVNLHQSVSLGSNIAPAGNDGQREGIASAQFFALIHRNCGLSDISLHPIMLISATGRTIGS